MTEQEIVTAERFEEVMCSSTNDTIKIAVKALFKKGDIIEVRAWDKEHNVYTGRCNYNTKLVGMLEQWDELGCDIYYVLNPVGDGLGLRSMASGGRCTWEADVLWRRRFLLDFDPKRDNKIATHAQWEDAYATAARAMEWLKGYGYKGIVMASSGNGCHLLVPCEMPNNAQSKELIRKVQRAVSNKFSTETVECECFPDANRLVRAYGSTNKKGTATEEMPYRQSFLISAAEGVDENPSAIMHRIIAENPVADAKTHDLGTGAGPFSRDLLYQRLEAWEEGWTNDDGDSFLYEDCDRKHGFRVLCPGALADGWPDGEQHESASDNLNDSTLVWVENGWPRFSCRHNHCAEGAEHGKKTWMDLQNYYDPERVLHRVVDEDTDKVSKWDVEYVDDGAPDAGEASVTSLDVFAEDDEEELVVTVKEYAVTVPSDEFEGADVPVPVEVSPVTESVYDPKAPVASEPAAEAPKRRKGQMPDSCMYGWLGWAARELETPLGFSYPALLTGAAALIKTYPRHIRPTMYTCLIGGVHCGKSETIKRAVGYKNQPGLLAMPDDVVKWTVPGSDRGLIKIFAKDKDEETLLEVGKVPTVLLAQDELRNTLAKVGIGNSSLSSTLCSAWEQDEVGTADKTGKHSADMHLNILGALKADDAEDFADVFSKDTTSGLYDRFIFGLAPKGWEFATWERNVPARYPKMCVVPVSAWDMMKAWRKVEPIGRGRLGEIAMRVAYVTSCMNHDPQITEEAMKCALEFVEWQEWIRNNYKAGLGDSDDTKCTNAILTVLEKLEPGQWIQWRTLASSKNWYRKFSATVLSRTREALLKSGATVEETIDDGSKTLKRTGRFRLRVTEDDETAAVTKRKRLTEDEEERVKGKPEPSAKWMSND